SPDVYGIPNSPGTFEETRVALALVCPSFNTSLDIVTSYGDILEVYCGNGTGDFSNVQEVHGDETLAGADYWVTYTPALTAPRYADLAVVGGFPDQQILALDIKQRMILALVPSSCGGGSLLYSITLQYDNILPSPLSRLV